MQNVVLIVHLLLAFALTAVVLLQRSEGGGLGIGGGGGATAGRPAQTAVGKLTWLLAIGFICTSLTLYVLAISGADGSSVADNIPVGGDGGDASEDAIPAGEDLIAPGIGGGDDDPLVPDLGE